MHLIIFWHALINANVIAETPFPLDSIQQLMLCKIWTS